MSRIIPCYLRPVLIYFYADFCSGFRNSIRGGPENTGKTEDFGMHNTVLTVLLVILIVVAVAFVVLVILGRRLQSKQEEQKQAIEASKQTVTMLVIDKKKLPLKEAGLPKLVYEQTPKYLRWAKVPIVKAKVGPKVATLIADEKIFPVIPVKQEIRAVISGIYITEVKSVRGGALPTPPAKKKLFGGLFRKKTNKKTKETAAIEKNNKKKS